ncbi:S8 family serine peptidase [bacterium]|nr:S8 family serine peptidase [bacterium]
MATKTKKASRQHSHAENKFGVIPTPVRLQADVTKSGKGITIAVIDAGFYPHPDLTKPVNRILAYHDVTMPESNLNAKRSPESWDWHGTQTCVAAAGNGYLSDGKYRGLASEANVVLVKVSDRGKITEENIARGLDWVLKNKENYNIRIASISLGGDKDVSYKENLVDQLAEEAVRQGIVVVVAAGNSGCTDQHHTVPPANAPSVITVGGYDDQNQLGNMEPHLYCSSFGPTADGLIKPEIIAPAMWVAAPILPRTESYKRATALSQLASAADYEIPDLTAKLWNILGLPESIHSTDTNTIRSTVEVLLQESKIISTHYQHVDGTSFAAPIVASVVAQMLEANPQLTPLAVKNILIATAERIRNAPVLRQGYGRLNAQAAVKEAACEKHVMDGAHFSAPRIDGNNLIFFYHDDSAEKVTLAGDFNNWNAGSIDFKKETNGIWRTEIAIPERGRYRYKFIINGMRWIDDPGNGMKEPDNYGEFNSIVTLM